MVSKALVYTVRLVVHRVLFHPACVSMCPYIRYVWASIPFGVSIKGAITGVTEPVWFNWKCIRVCVRIRIFCFALTYVTVSIMGCPMMQLYSSPFLWNFICTFVIWSTRNGMCCIYIYRDHIISELRLHVHLQHGYDSLEPLFYSVHCWLYRIKMGNKFIFTCVMLHLKSSVAEFHKNMQGINDCSMDSELQLKGNRFQYCFI